MTLLQVDLLGDLQMRSASGSLVTISAKKSQALLAYLGVKPAQRVSREKIASLLWSSTGPDQARQSLRQTLSTLRKELAQLSPDERILIEENDLLGLDETNVSCDVAAFESLVAAGTEQSLAKASTLYRGDFLDGFQINEERFDQWVTAERDRLGRWVPSLATIGSVSPLIGLLGTVLGIIDAFVGIASKGSGNIGAVAPGVAGEPSAYLYREDRSTRARTSGGGGVTR